MKGQNQRIEPPSLRPGKTRWPHSAAVWLALICAIAAPVPFGSVDLVPSLAIIGWLSLTLMIAIWSAPPRVAMAIGFVVVLTALFPAIYFLQLAYGPSSEQVRALLLQAQQTLDAAGNSVRVTLHRQPLEAFAPPLLAGLAICVGLAIGSNAYAARRFQERFAWLSAIYIVIALALFLAAPRKVLWFTKAAHIEDFTATFLNRNTAAIFIGISAVCMSGVLLRAHRQWRRIKAGRRAVDHRIKRKLVLGWACIAALAVALLLTNSRAGISLSVAAAALPFLLQQRKRAGRRSNTVALAAIGFMIVAPIVVGMLDLRISTQLAEGGGRLDTYRATIAIIGANPWLGVGLGNFAAVFPLWRLADQNPWGVWDRAHQVWLELAAEAGLPLALIIAASWLASGLILAQSAVRTRSTSASAGLSVFLLGTAHSLVDFAIQIPGCAVAFFLIAGSGFGLAFRHDRP
jgi:O-antigen ligase